jgi:general secretion pathway protein G
MTRSARHSSRHAFTMIELLLVMTIMTVIGVFAAMAINNVHDNAKIQETRATIRLFEIALEKYKGDMGEYPSGDTTAMIAALSEGSAWKGAGKKTHFPSRSELKDAWGMPFYYTSSSEYTVRGCERTPGKNAFYNTSSYQIYSMGPNMKTWTNTVADGGHPRLGGTEPDDIRNWKQESTHGARPAAYATDPPTP